MEGIKEESVGYLFNVEVEVDEGPEAEADEEHPVVLAKGLERARSGRASSLQRADPRRGPEPAAGTGPRLRRGRDAPQSDGPTVPKPANRAERRAAKRNKD